MNKKQDPAEGSKFEILFVGRSNVGKSSLIRELTGKKVRVGKRPGVTLKPSHLRFSDMLITDLPGFGFMSGIKERKQDIVKDKIVRYIEDNTDRINVAVLVIDGSVFMDVADRWDARGEIPIDVELFHFLNELDIDTIIAVNKIDKIKSEDLNVTLNCIAQRIGLIPPWQQWPQTIAPISVKKNDTTSVKELIRKRLHDAKRDDLFRYI
ncbi:MAG: GTP-binding protein EngB [Methanosarcinaceae archaeon]|nr:GTP-binding protein EngB [Methanosarcinaceae archaeon]